MDQEFIEKLKNLIAEYSEKNAEGEKDCEKETVKPEGEMIIIQGETENGELPEEISDLINFIRRG